MTNIWWREDDTLVTPSLELGILAGETRAALLDLARGVGYEVETGTYPVERLHAADEVFTSSSVREVMPVVAVDPGRAPKPRRGGRAAARTSGPGHRLTGHESAGAGAAWRC